MDARNIYDMFLENKRLLELIDKYSREVKRLNAQLAVCQEKIKELENERVR